MPTAPESLIIDEWLYDTLSADATILAAVGTRIYAEIAPQDSDLPCVVYSGRPVRDVMAVGAIRIWEALEYNIRAIGQYESFYPLQGVADAIDTALHAGAGAAGSGTGTVLTCTREQEIRYVEVDDGVQYRHLGGLYLIRAQKA